MGEIVATNLVASRPPKCWPTGTPTACANSVFPFLYFQSIPNFSFNPYSSKIPYFPYLANISYFLFCTFYIFSSFQISGIFLCFLVQSFPSPYFLYSFTYMSTYINIKYPKTIVQSMDFSWKRLFKISPQLNSMHHIIVITVNC